MATTAVDSGAAQLHAILPHFTGENVEHWLRLCEYAFKTFKIENSDQKVYALYRSLPSEIQLELSSILESDDTNKYKVLKDGIIKLTALPTQRQLERLLNEAQLGDRKPSVFLRHLRQLAGAGDSDAKLVRSIFLNRLPTTISQILAPMSGESLDALAQSADQIFEYLPKSSTINTYDVQVPTLNQADGANSWLRSISALEHASRTIQSSNKATFDAIAGLQAQITSLQNSFSSSIANLQSQVSSLQSLLHSTTTATNNRSNSRTRFSRASESATNLCYYHSKFGSNASKCTKPCSWQPSGN